MSLVLLFNVDPVPRGAAIVNLTGMTVSPIGSSFYRCVKTAGDGATNGEVYNATPITGDFVLRIQHNPGTFPGKGASIGMASTDPTLSTALESADYGWFIDGSGAVRTERFGVRNAFAPDFTNDPIWIGRVGDTLTWRNGAAWDTATVVDTQTGTLGIGLRLDSSFYDTGGDFDLQLYEVAALYPVLLTNSQTFYAPTATVGAAPLTPSLFTNAQTFYAATVTTGAVALTPSLFTNSQTFYVATVNSTYPLTPDLFTDTDTFFAPTVTPGAAALTPSLFTNSQTFYAATVTAGAVGLTPSLFTNSQTFYDPTVTVGAVSLTPSLFTNTQTFYAAAVTVGAIDLTPALFTNTQTFYAPTAAVGAVALTPSLFTNAQTFYSPTVVGVAEAQDLTPSLFTNASTFYSPLVELGAAPQFIFAEMFANDNIFFAPTVSFRRDLALRTRRLRESQRRYTDKWGVWR